MVIVYHPVTMAADTLEETDELFAALRAAEAQLIFCYPNSDAGSRALISRTKEFLAERGNGKIFVNLDPLSYWSLLRHAQVFLGNSSSGILEASVLRVPVVNIGNRQQGRLRPGNVIDTPAEQGAIEAAIQRALSPDFRSGSGVRDDSLPFGRGAAHDRLTHRRDRAMPRGAAAAS